MFSYHAKGTIRVILGGYLLATILAPALFAQGGASSNPTETLHSAPSPVPVHAASHSRYQPDRFAGRAGTYYRLIWGIDSLEVKVAESGKLIRFSYRVLNADKAIPLHDKKLDPKLIDPVNHLALAIPSLEKVGQLRQTGAPESGRSYWMAFSNPHRDVKKGDRVNVVIGQFHADGLVVE